MNRDQILEQAIAQELRAAEAPLTPACLDAETLAAWLDGGLDAAAMAAAEDHASRCDRCQAMLATILRAAAEPSAQPAAPQPLWRWWFAPLVATAAAVTIWMVVPSQREIANAPPAPSAPVAAAPPAPEAAAPEPGRDSTPPRAGAPARSEQLQNKATAATRQSAARQSFEDRAVPADAAKPAPQLAAPAAAPAPAAPVATLAETVALTREVASPDGARRWRFADYGPDVSGGAAVSSSVCWLIGKGGLVMLTTDGTTFDHVDLPDNTDVVSITAVDARSASVTTVDGRRFQTDDGGRTWRLIQA